MQCVCVCVCVCVFVCVCVCLCVYFYSDVLYISACKTHRNECTYKCNGSMVVW